MTIPFKKELPIILASTLAMTSPLFANDQPLETVENPTITIYQGGVALITEARNFELNNELRQLFLPNVAPETMMESLMISFTPKEKDQPVPVITEKKLNRNLLSPQAMIQYSVGEEVTVITSNSGREKQEKATIISNNGGLLLQYKDRIELDLPENARLAFKTIPAGLNNTPVLSVILKNLPENRALYRADLSYLTRGLSWNTDYIAKLDEASKTLKLEGWATLNNNSGMDYQDYKINLIAGDLNIVSRAVPQLRKAGAAMALDMNYEAAPIAATSLGDYHLYKIPDTSTLNDKEQTQISLFQKDAIPFTKNYTFANNSPNYRMGQSPAFQNAMVTVHFKNDETSQLGFPLPDGVIRLYQQEDTQTTFIGEDHIPATPNKQEVILNTGSAFDITMKREQTQFAMVNEDEWEISYKLTVSNAKKEAAHTFVKESFYPNNDTNWQIINQSKPPKIVGDTAIWELEIPAESNKIITYNVRYTIFNDEKKERLNP
ncbi:DUF4139 domain-containing protein [Ignatzschineria rhizosphaerae]|uniref:DUF4139 domain-containing protein n=1 Tax=Ignatzschineria rhizosphaerae TaxID=2923279 RepID=A0ABY3WXK6_9GAMM|nr:DUF4139 domain-containing protein [Ignatzschineria rhizosphaerae]UNM95339.1 DUF4139 domain-containing protein [Ignatzschineria rhizosphaerae]